MIGSNNKKKAPVAFTISSWDEIYGAIRIIVVICVVYLLTFLMCKWGQYFPGRFINLNITVYLMIVCYLRAIFRIIFKKEPEWTVFELNEDGIYWTERLNRKGKIVYWEDIHQVAFCLKEGVPATKKKKAIPGRAVHEVRLHDGRSIEIDLEDYIGWYSFRLFKKAMVLFSGRNDIFVNEYKYPWLIFFWYCDLFYTNNYRYPKE